MVIEIFQIEISNTEIKTNIQTNQITLDFVNY